MSEETQILTRWVDPTIDDFKIALEEANKQIEEIYKEIERLNNIINELERHLEQQWLEWKDDSNDEIAAMANEDKCILDKLRKLKGDSSNE